MFYGTYLPKIHDKGAIHEIVQGADFKTNPTEDISSGTSYRYALYGGMLIGHWQ